MRHNYHLSVTKLEMVYQAIKQFYLFLLLLNINKLVYDIKFLIIFSLNIITNN